MEPEVLEAALGVPVVPMTATRAAGVHDCWQAIQEMLAAKRVVQPHRPRSAPTTAWRWTKSQRQITGYVPAPYPTDWAALKLLEGDAEITRMMQAALPAERWEPSSCAPAR